MTTSRSPQNPNSSSPDLSAAGVFYDAKAELLRYAETAEDPRFAAGRMTFDGTGGTPAAKAAMESIRADLTPDAERKMSAYRPELPADNVAVIRNFVENAVAIALPLTSYTVETLIRPCMAFVYWAVFVVGCPLDARVVFERALIEQYIHSDGPAREDGTALTDGTLRNYRAWILRVAEAVNPDNNPRNTKPLTSRAMDEPYDDDEQFVLDRWADGQTTAYMRQGANTLIALGAGAGLSSGEIAVLRRDAVAVDDNRHITIRVTATGGAPDRDVVVAAKHEKRLAKAMKHLAADDFVFLPNRKAAVNDVVSAFVGRSFKPSGTPAVTGRGLRNTWLVERITDRVDVFTLMKAAGLQSLESISRLATYVPRPDAETRTAQLRGKK